MGSARSDAAEIPFLPVVLAFLAFLPASVAGSVYMSNATGTAAVAEYCGSMSASPSSLSVNVTTSTSVSRNITLSEDNCNVWKNVTMSASSNDAGSWVLFSPKSFLLAPGVSNVTAAYVVVPSGVSDNNYTGTIYAARNDYSLEIPLAVRVFRSYTFDISVAVPSGQKARNPGDNVYAQVTVTMLSGTAGDVTMRYRIISPGNVTVDERNETVAVSTSVQRTPLFALSSSAVLGTYTFQATVLADSTSASASDSFTVAAAAAAPSAAPSGGGGGGAPAGAPPVAEIIGISLLLSGEQLQHTAKYVNELGIVGLSIEAAGTMSNAQMVIKEAAAPDAPAVVAQDKGGVYKYLEFSKSNFNDADVKMSKIKFRVANAWLEANDLDENAVALNRLNNNAWQKLPNAMFSSDANYYYYEAATPGYSVFAITAEKRVRHRIEITDAPAALDIVQGLSELFSVEVKNTGNKSLTNVTLALADVPPQWFRFSPKTVELLQPGSTAAFVGTVLIPRESEPAEIRTKIRAASAEAATEKSFTLRIIAKKPYTENINDLRNIVNRLWNRTMKDDYEGRNVTHVFGMLRQASEKIGQAEDYWNAKNYSAYYAASDDVKSLVEKASSALSATEHAAPATPFVAPGYAYAAAAAILIVAAALWLLRSRRKQRYWGGARDQIKSALGRGSR